MKRIYLAFLCTILVCSFLVIAPHQQAFAATRHTDKPLASCYGAGCFNKDPYASGCKISATKQTKAISQSGVYLGVVINQYSSICNANWAEGYIVNAPGLSLIALPSGADSGHNPLCYPDNCSSFYTGSYTAWTNMVDGTNQVKVCGRFGTSNTVSVTCVTQ